jgi:hypothetical protein
MEGTEMKKYILGVAFSLFSVISAYEIDVIVDEASGHPFEVNRVSTLPGIRISDVQYFSDELVKKNIRQEQVRYFVSVPLIDFLSSHDENRLLYFQNSKGRFWLKLAPATSSAPPYPVVLNERGETGNDAICGSYRVSCSYKRSDGGYVVHIADVTEPMQSADSRDTVYSPWS